MSDKEFIIEAITRLLPTTEWYGETYHDNEANDNLYLYEEILEMVFDKVADNYGSKRKGNYSADMLSITSRKIITNFIANNIDIIGEVVDKIRKEETEDE